MKTYMITITIYNTLLVPGSTSSSSLSVTHISLTICYPHMRTHMSTQHCQIAFIKPSTDPEDKSETPLNIINLNLNRGLVKSNN